jgi:hypothetical protein
MGLLFLATAPAFAEKPPWAGKKKPAHEQVTGHGKAMGSRTDDDVEEMKEAEKAEGRKRWEKRVREERGEAEETMTGAVPQQEEKEKKGLEKQREKKAQQVQKELDKGSEKGQEARQKRKKWWKFWE